ncbi:MAG: hypothetical protein RL204_1695 [Bacteroidota bacterium]
MLSFFNKRNHKVNFTEENKERMTTLLTEMYQILRDSAYTAQAQEILQIMSAVHKEDQKAFKEKVISGAFNGGAGSVLDVYIEDKNQTKRLHSSMKDFLELTIKSGLDHKALKSTSSLLTMLNEKK